jgi:hypothetical protein
MAGVTDTLTAEPKFGTAARSWVEAANTWGGLGQWVHHICHEPADLCEQLASIEPVGVGASVAQRQMVG